MGYIDNREQDALQRVLDAEERLKRLDGTGARLDTEERMIAAENELDLVQSAKRSLLPSYLGKFIKCTACNRPFHDEGSYLAHWESNRGRIGCIFTESILTQKGFVVDEHLGTPYSLYVLRHPRHQTK